MKITIDDFRVIEGKSVNLKNYTTQSPENFKKNKKEIKKIIKNIDYYQNILNAENKQSLLIILQGIDAAGKDSSIRAIMTGVNPQGVNVSSFKTPSSLEYEHDYLWRHIIKMPERGKIEIFNRSHYENVLVCKVHPEFILNEKIPTINSVKDINDEFFEKRYEEIKNFENRMFNNGTRIIKFFLNISKDEQKKRFIKRINEKEKNWKFSASDLKERKFWNEYQKAFAMAFEKTSTENCPWFIVPFDNKSYGQLVMAYIINETLKSMNPKYPEVNKQEKEALKIAYQDLLNEKD
ncbi:MULTISPECIES: PPK2 family polyphosphate kinase [unclassified Apibacter]|uniref:PPK2 family polyphosphate kinase n=1 Tax=unclassified Apibacter TaxID=2630820 RepID=UPI00132645BB|nr:MULTISPECIES: PPK2 family polyphosphate kinase [unclassified Apibacter]MXO24132.1 polyphosphate kinase 2 family protein [Apibacter sp. B3924]MXO26187.1 polyphosphate kinase 2 family protein [Apibacter sp. B3813]MXO28138.1 polyphosphate kinase 2 family protein [Apibacter sp. B3913]MXO30092.1 polyphosphate kinase 2 family protein [Apibacter sp. B3912]MXP01857.1 polyphosphate kinase 2 family protein [Apibacter sp. B3918]